MRLHWLLPSVLGFFLLTSPAQAARLLFLRFDANQNRLDLTTDQAVQPRIQVLTNPSRIIVDLPGISLERSTVEQQVGGAVRAVRVGQFDSRTMRVVIELNPGYTIALPQVQLRRNSSREWTVELQGLGGVAQSPNPIVLQQSRPLPPAPSNLPADLPRIPSGRMVVVIDPGHGGTDPGAVGIGGLQEKDIIMPISQRVAEILERQGVQAVLTRTGDYDLDLPPRVQLAQRVNAAAFVSIHANAVANRPNVSGVETYHFDRGLGLAQSIQNSIVQSIDVTDRGVRRARFYVLRSSSMPSVLVEVGFVTGTQDAQRLATAEYRNQMAEAIARGILQYLQGSFQR